MNYLKKKMYEHLSDVFELMAVTRRFDDSIIANCSLVCGQKPKVSYQQFKVNGVEPHLIVTVECCQFSEGLSLLIFESIMKVFKLFYHQSKACSYKVNFENNVCNVEIYR